MAPKKHLKPRAQMPAHPREKHVDPDGSVSAHRMNTEPDKLDLCTINGRIFSANGVFRNNKDLDLIADYFAQEYAPDIIAEWESNRNKTFAIWRSTDNFDNRRTVSMIVPPEILAQTQGLYSYMSDATTGLTYVRSTNACRVLCEPIFVPNDETGIMDIDIRFITIYPTAETDTLDECVDRDYHYGAAHIAPEVYRRLDKYVGKATNNNPLFDTPNPARYQNWRRCNQIKMDLVNSDAMTDDTEIIINDRCDRLSVIVDTPMDGQFDVNGEPLTRRMKFTCRLNGDGSHTLMKSRMMYVTTQTDPQTGQKTSKLACKQPPDNEERLQRLIDVWKEEHKLFHQDFALALAGPYKPTDPSIDTMRIAKWGDVTPPNAQRTPCDTSHIKQPDAQDPSCSYN